MYLISTLHGDLTFALYCRIVCRNFARNPQAHLDPACDRADTLKLLCGEPRAGEGMMSTAMIYLEFTARCMMSWRNIKIHQDCWAFPFGPERYQLRPFYQDQIDSRAQVPPCIFAACQTCIA